MPSIEGFMDGEAFRLRLTFDTKDSEEMVELQKLMRDPHVAPTIEEREEHRIIVAVTTDW